ncbi:MAG: STAS/SEC14 domain-containing protein [Patescibacteria group bacterium]
MTSNYKINYHYPETNVGVIMNDDGILEIHYSENTYTEEENVAETVWVRDTLDKIISDYPDIKIYALMDVTSAGDAEEISDESMKIYSKTMNYPQVKNIAIFGQTKWFAMLLNIMVKLSKTFGKTKLFDDKENAIAWLKEKKAKR